jgi:hypothetical protein
MARTARFRVVLALAVGDSLVLLVFLLAGSAGSWAVGQATWVWYEHVARRELPFPSLADVGHLLAIPLAAAAMLAFPGRAERAALQVRSLLDGAVIAAGPLWPWSC